MKKLLFLFTALLCLNATKIKAQSYHKFLNQSSWYQSVNPGFGFPISYFYYNQTNDTVINSTIYSKIIALGNTPNLFFVREDTIAKKVFILADTVNAPEVILYDYSLHLGDTLYAKHGWGAGHKLIVKTIDSVTTLVGYRKRFYLSDTSGNFNYQTIESIGCPLDPFLNDYAVGDPQSTLVCNYQKNTQQYDCACGLSCFDYAPMCFNPPVAIPVYGWANIIISADFNTDGNADIVTNYHQGISISFGDGLGNFSSPTNYYTGDAISLTSADFNNDGHKDILVFRNDSIFVLLGDGLGSFPSILKSFSGTYINYFNTTTSIASADFNGDGKLDVAIPNYSNSTGSVNVFLGNGNGTFGAPNSFQTVTYAGSVLSADFNNDNKIDLAVIGAGLSILLGNGTGSFAAPVNHLTYFFQTSFTKGDFNVDGKTDIALMSDDSLFILLGTGTGGFNNPTVFASKPYQSSIFASDFNNDGKTDLAIGCGSDNCCHSTQAPGPVVLFSGNGHGNFLLSDTIEVVSGGSPYLVIGSDFNNDGHIDMATTTYTAGTTANIIMNCSTGTVSGINNKIDNNNLQLKIYPNPANNKITIDANDVIDVKLFDILGKQITSTKTNEVDVSNLTNGVYFIQVQTKQNTSTQKIIIQH